MTIAPALTRENNASNCSPLRLPWLVLRRARPWALSFLALLLCAIQPNAAKAWDGPFPSFNFVSYEGKSSNAAKQLPATEPAWFLVNSGYRWEVMPQQMGQEDDELDRLLTEWLETHVFD